MANSVVSTFNFDQLYPETADRLLVAKAGQCWASPQEAAAAARGDYPHGTIDDCGDFQRIWNDDAAVWLNTYS